MAFPCCYAKQLVFLKNTFQPTEINMSSFESGFRAFKVCYFWGHSLQRGL